jgi:transcriptional regulator with XRE-family HTH domain
MKRFGEKLRFLREQHGMTQQNLADALGFAAHVHIHNLETGKKQPNVELVVKLCKLFNVSADALIMDEHDLEGMGGQAGE